MRAIRAHGQRRPSAGWPREFTMSCVAVIRAERPGGLSAHTMAMRDYTMELWYLFPVDVSVCSPCSSAILQWIGADPR